MPRGLAERRDARARVLGERGGGCPYGVEARPKRLTLRPVRCGSTISALPAALMARGVKGPQAYFTDEESARPRSSKGASREAERASR
jgi:hypothetical protein